MSSMIVSRFALRLPANFHANVVNKWDAAQHVLIALAVCLILINLGGGAIYQCLRHSIVLIKVYYRMSETFYRTD